LTGLSKPYRMSCFWLGRVHFRREYRSKLNDFFHDSEIKTVLNKASSWSRIANQRLGFGVIRAYELILFFAFIMYKTISTLSFQASKGLIQSYISPHTSFFSKLNPLTFHIEGTIYLPCTTEAPKTKANANRNAITHRWKPKVICLLVCYQGTVAGTGESPLARWPITDGLLTITIINRNIYRRG
jgi:hypothetical protein